MLITEWTARIASACDKQFHLRDLVATSEWQFSLATGLLSFDPFYSWQVQLLGTESESTRSWLWGWANTLTHISDHLLEASGTMKAFGKERGITELVKPEVSLTQIDGHTLALLASGICEANAYYRCPFDGGALFVLIKDENFPKCPDPPLRRIAKVFPQVIASLEIPDHKLALAGYLGHYGLSHERDGDNLVVKENGEAVLAATFDDQNRLTALEVKLEGSAESSEESWDERQIQRMLRG
jgi:hypothetical protein